MVTAISADGARLAIASAESTATGRCTQVTLWESSTGNVTRLHATRGCSGARSDFEALTLAGSRLAWADYAEARGDTYCRIDAMTIAGGAPKELYRCPQAATTAYFAGDGALLAASVSTGLSPDARVRPVWRVAGGALQRLFDARGATVESVAAGQVLVREQSGVVLYSTAGKKLRGFAEASDLLRALYDGDSVVLVYSGAASIYTAKTGKKLRDFVPGIVNIWDLERGFLAYSRNGTISLYRLSDGRNRTILRAGHMLTGVELEPSGLFYAYNLTSGQKPGRFGFIPFSELAARFA